MKKIIFIILFAAVSLVLSDSPSFAYNGELKYFNDTYGTEGTRLNSCTLCHPGSNVSSINNFGSDYKSNGWFFDDQLEKLDSDGDSFSNIEEVNALTFPGDSNDYPADSTNVAPIADAGADQTVMVGDTVTLDGSGSSDADSDSLSFSWSLVSRPAGSTAALSEDARVNPAFEVDLPGTYVAQLIVNDGIVDSVPDTVIISTRNSAPVADAGPDQSVFIGDSVTLDGSNSSDVDGDSLVFVWSFVSVPAGSSALLSDPAAVMPTFDVDVSGTYVVQLIVNDGKLDSDPDTVTISTVNSAPVAEAGKRQRARIGETVTLDGSKSSDADGNTLSFNWSLTSVPEDSGAELSDPTAVNPSFEMDKPGTYVVQLIVNDGTVDSAADTCIVKVRKGGKPGKGGGNGKGKDPGGGS